MEGLQSISRARTTFCWLPPENDVMRSLGLGGRTSKEAIFASQWVRIAFL